MKNKPGMMLAVSGTVAVLSMIVSELLMAEVPSPTRTVPTAYPVMQAYPAAPGGWSELFRHG